MHEHGLTWGRGTWATPYVYKNGDINTKWTEGDPYNCYSNQGKYDSLKYYNQEGTQILKFSAYDFEED